MNSRHAQAALGVCVLVSACRTMDQPPPYFPLRVGATWEYATAQSHVDFAELPGADSEERVTSVRRARGGIEAEIESRWGHGPWSRHVVRVTQGGQEADIQVASSAGGVRTLVRRGMYLPVPLPPGKSWEYEIEYVAAMQHAHLTGQGKVVGNERIVVPAGAFDTVHIERVTHNHVEIETARDMPPVPPLDSKQTDDEYYARGVGLVLSRTRTGTGYGAARVLVRFTPGR
jgi:hypothetical protein